mmetsp:Transcript_24093/g.27454  ORF Transcript_24093/g.27454 Transcript_24093/m.27454 type:complete len:277 (-) Transcript_24093:661-1491(-)
MPSSLKTVTREGPSTISTVSQVIPETKEANASTISSPESIMLEIELLKTSKASGILSVSKDGIKSIIFSSIASGTLEILLTMFVNLSRIANSGRVGISIPGISPISKNLGTLIGLSPIVFRIGFNTFSTTKVIPFSIKSRIKPPASSMILPRASVISEILNISSPGLIQSPTGVSPWPESHCFMQAPVRIFFFVLKVSLPRWSFGTYRSHVAECFFFLRAAGLTQSLDLSFPLIPGENPFAEHCEYLWQIFGLKGGLNSLARHFFLHLSFPKTTGT